MANHVYTSWQLEAAELSLFDEINMPWLLDINIHVEDAGLPDPQISPSHGEREWSRNLLASPTGAEGEERDVASKLTPQQPLVREPMGPPMIPNHQEASTAGTGPPINPRKRKARTLTIEDWEPHKLQIIELYINQNRPLEDVMDIIQTMTGFTATYVCLLAVFGNRKKFSDRPSKRQYQSRIKQWDLNKNVQPEEMEAIVRKRQRRKLIETHKNAFVAEVRNRPVETHKIVRWMRHHGISEDEEYAPSPAARESNPSL